MVPGCEPHQLLQHQYQEGALGTTRRLLKPHAVLVPWPPATARKHADMARPAQALTLILYRLPYFGWPGSHLGSLNRAKMPDLTLNPILRIQPHLKPMFVIK